MTVQVPIAGLLDLDSPNETIQRGYFKYARNICFMAGRPENTKGTRQITYTLPAGDNECIGAYYDDLKQRTIWFNYNSAGNHGIYQMVNGTITTITVCGGTDYLNFTQYPIHSINILYGDTTVGDIIYFVDSLKRPTKINIDRAISGGYGTIDRTYFDVAKEQPELPPVVSFANDNTATINNLRKGLFQFRTVWTYDDKENSAFSTISEIPIPPGFLDVANDADPTKNSKITVTVRTGKPNVKKIKLVARQNVDNVWGDWFLLTVLDKAELSIANNSTYTYDFKNNNAAQYLDVKEAALLFDSVPREANTQELLNGNIVIYGGIKEGYNSGITSDVTLVVDDVVTTAGANDILPIYNYSSKYKLGLAYFDEKGRTNGVISGVKFDVTTLAYNETTGVAKIPRINASISHRPPVWAKTYQWVRTKNLTYQKFLYWVSQSTYKDNEFAYISINNLFLQQETNKKTILTYDFEPGDRIRFIKRIGYNLLANRDFEIKEQVVSPEVNGKVLTGVFLKIKLPATGSDFDFGITNYGNYLINLYSPAQVVGKELDVFYEFGAAYLIGNPGQSTRYHIGQTQNQSTNLATPATFVFTKGDAYLKSRVVPSGSDSFFEIVPTKIQFAGSRYSLPLNNVSSNIGNASYQTGTTVGLGNYGGTAFNIKTNATGYTFRIKGSIRLIADQDVKYNINIYTSPTTPPYSNDVPLVPPEALEKDKEKEVKFDTTIFVPPNTILYFYGLSSAVYSNVTLVGGSITISEATTYGTFAIDANFSDTFLSAVNSNGRPLVVDETGETYNPALFRYSEAYQAGTNINGTNRFYPLNFLEIDRSKGDIQRLKVRGSDLKVFQSRGCCAVGIFQQEMRNADGTGNLIVTDNILNKPRYYQGEYGIGNQPTSLASSSGADYFSDPIRGYQIRLAGDGMTPISQIYKAQYYLPTILERYLHGYTTDTGSTAKILGTYDFFHEEFISVMQKCKNGATVIYGGDALAFSETRNGYSTTYDYYVEQMICAGNDMVSWKGGAIYVHDSNTRNTFHGTYYPSMIDIVINENPNVKKEYVALGYHSKTEWSSPVISTSLSQASNLIAGDYEFRESMFHAALLRDSNSLGGLIDGDYLNGVWMQIRLQNNSTALEYLTGLYFNYLVSPKNF